MKDPNKDIEQNENHTGKTEVFTENSEIFSAELTLSCPTDKSAGRQSTDSYAIQEVGEQPVGIGIGNAGTDKGWDMSLRPMPLHR